ncbi:peptidoglycan D,D-transpeptidase FtsI family protein [Microbacterium saperdae]|uniref:Cell division protein FtsI (Penicillin-binding protein 3) n=1 Tax=Microbacterium saperdae TaxID=69368 RepID=A0A543BLK0_9MICO|nr:penicillin-binding protein 2 [Microbacterium saperdae]TQL85709.1 cell division protein FtsI (penicillin-binding protein 3) [Microbacterium saperdae]GGM53595.1 cell division protein FtsI [Microbacterium saperdae]
MTTRATRGPRRRTVVALAVILSVLAVFVVRLVDIQVVSADEHVNDSLKHIGKGDSISGQRGTIVDASGTVLASSVMVYDAELSPLVITELEKKEPKVPWDEAADKIAAVTGQTGDEVRALVANALAENAESQYVQLKKSLTTDQYIELRDLKLAYLHMTARETRVYPNGAVAGNIVGFLDGSGKAQAGIEKMEQSCLAPVNGEESYRIGKDGVVIPGSERTVNAVDGGTVQLTINSDLNWYLQQMITEEAQKQGAKGGTVTVVEVKTGKIRAAAEWPALDPNDLGSMTADDWGSEIFHHDFEPGSTFKAITAAAAMEGAGLTPLSTVSASSREKFPNGAVINDAFSHAAYNYTLAGALIDSSNVALSKFGTTVSPDVRYDYLQRFGVGKDTIGFPTEVSGTLHPVSEWDNQSLYTTTFGQFFTVTAAQVAGAYQAIANGGEKIDLSLIESCTKPDGTVVAADAPKHEQIVTEQTAADLTRMLENVAVQGGNAERIQVPGYRVTSKTGTAQVPDGKGGYKAGVYYTSMVGFAPVDDPQYVVVVTLDEPTKVVSSAATASAFQKAMTQVMKTYRVMPSSVPMDELLPKFE